MATIVANGNASVMSRAMMDTDDGYFEHANSVAVNRARPKIFGPSTVWVDGEAYPDSYWAGIRIHPVEHPYIKGRWIHPDRFNEIKAAGAKNVLAMQKQPDISEGGMNDAGYIKNKPRVDAKRAAYQGASSATKNALNAVTNAPGKLAKAAKNTDWGKSASDSIAAYDAAHRGQRKYTRDVNGNMVYTGMKDTGNAAGRALAGARGVLGQEGRNIKGGWDSATAAYDAAHRGQRSYKRDEKGNMTYAGLKGTGNVVGRTMAGVKSAIGASAVGRAGQAAFNAILDKFDDFKKGIEKYLTGDNAKANRSQALKDLNEKGGALIGNIRSALGRLGTSEGRTQALDKVTGTIGGTVSGIARGIASSNIGQAAINAGRNAYGAVKDKVVGAIESIQKFFQKKKQTTSRAHLNSREATV